MEVLLDNRQDAPIDEELWAGRIAEAMRAAGVPEGAQISISFVSDDEIHELNREHRSKDRPTDVLSFPTLEPGEEPPPGMPLMLGDVVVSVETADRQAHEYGHTLDRELGFLLVHGLLHLLGEDHETPDEEQRMRERQRKILSAIGLGSDAI